MFYKVLRPLIFKLSPECAHDAAIFALKNNLVPAQQIPNYSRLQCNFFNTDFNHPLGLSAGFDKNGECINNMSKLGFSFLELGTVTPKAQIGNPKPRIFRLPKQQAIVNKLGFNNKGADYFLSQLQNSQPTIPIGANIGKNKDGTNEDFLIMLEKTHQHANYITINISSPNTVGLRDLQKQENIEQFLQLVKEKKEELNCATPIFIKISPDMSQKELQFLVEKVIEKGCFQGLIVSNTTINHYEIHQGGLSGKPLFERSLHTLKQVYEITQGNLTLIASGGVFSTQDIVKKIQAGANLIQMYTAFIYKGFGIIPKILQDLDSILQKNNINNIAEIVGTDRYIIN